MTKKIGFWSVLALVVGSQIGSAVFMLPASLASFGIYSLAGWLVSAFGAMSLALVFASLCAKFPITGGPHVYVEQLFGRDVAFFVGWTYWVVSWISTTAVIVAVIGYLSPFIGQDNTGLHLMLELGLLVIILILNLYGVNAAGRVEAVFTLLKFLPLLVVPMVAIWHFDINNFEMRDDVISQPVFSSIGQAALLTLWGFVGVESATTPAGSVENPQKTIPKALIIGTSLVAVIYIFNSVSIMGLIKGSSLATSNAPYVDAAKNIFGGNWHFAVAIAASIVCLGTLNAWVLTSGQISLGLAEDKLMPAIFAKRNGNDAPYIGLILSCCGMIPLLFLTAKHGIAKQVTAVIDFSVTSFLFIYLLCSIVSLVLLRSSLFNRLNSLVASLFCLWVIYETQASTLLISSLFTLSGIPLYFFWYKKTNH